MVTQVQATARRRPLRVRAMKITRVTHRWASLLVGALLLVVTTTGAILVLEPEERQVAHPGQFVATHTGRQISPDEAIAVARRRYPGAGAPTRVVRNRGVFQVALGDPIETVVSVDPGTGRVLGAIKPDRGVLGFVANLHECGLTCEGYPGYVAFLTKPMPGLGIPGLHNVEIGSFLLACFAGILGLLVISGAVLWWPGIRRWRRGFRVRLHKGRYARDYDLHKLVGVVSLPFLGMWALTGANFELPVVSNAVYAVIGDKPAPTPDFESAKAPKGAADISTTRADAMALAKVPGGRVIGTNLPTPGDPTSTYLVWVAHGIDPLSQSDYAGNVGVGVDRHGGRAEVLYGALGRPLRQTIWDDWTTGAHYGQFMGWLPRLIWLGFGLTPLALAATGVSTWLYRRRKRSRRRVRVLPATSASA